MTSILNQIDALYRSRISMNITAWDLEMLALAQATAADSPDPSTKTGAVIVDRDGHVVSVGCNRLSRGVIIADLPHWLSDRAIKYKAMVHCESIAMLHAHRDIRGSTLYTWPFMSCAPCAGNVKEAGIVRAVAPRSDNPRWQKDFALAIEIFTKAGITLDFADPVADAL
jgi:dCMP deaminase